MSTGILIVTNVPMGEYTYRNPQRTTKPFYESFYQGGEVAMPQPYATPLFERLVSVFMQKLEDPACTVLMNLALLKTKLRRTPKFWNKEHIRIESNYFVAHIGSEDEVYIIHDTGLCWIWVPSYDIELYRPFQSLVGHLLKTAKKYGDVIIDVNEFPEKILVGRDQLTQRFMQTLLEAFTDRYNLGWGLEKDESGNVPPLTLDKSCFDKFVLDAPEPEPLVFGSMWRIE